MRYVPSHDSQQQHTEKPVTLAGNVLSDWQAAGAVMADMRKQYPVLVEEASLVSRAMIKVCIHVSCLTAGRNEKAQGVVVTWTCMFERGALLATSIFKPCLSLP